MISCERCGHEMPDNVNICPACGTVASHAKPPTNSTAYGTGQGGFGSPPQAPSTYEQGYSRQQPPSQPAPYQSRPGYGYLPPPQNPNTIPQAPGYAPPGYAQVPGNVTVINQFNSKNTTPLIVEIIISCFGIYGIGWLMAGETTTGVLLLIGSLVLFWPLAILVVVLTFGLGALCIGPLAIAAVIVNAILLNNHLNRQAILTQQVFMQPPIMQPPIR